MDARGYSCTCVTPPHIKAKKLKIKPRSFKTEEK